MSVELVLDASVSVAWFLKESPERAAYAASVIAVAAEGAVLHVPAHWAVEMGHVLLREYRRRGLSRTRLNQALTDLDSFDIHTHFEPPTPRRIVELADRYHLQGYDALYFDLAYRLKLPLATLDQGQRQAARTHRVALFAASI